MQACDWDYDALDADVVVEYLQEMQLHNYGVYIYIYIYIYLYMRLTVPATPSPIIDAAFGRLPYFVETINGQGVAVNLPNMSKGVLRFVSFIPRTDCNITLAAWAIFSQSQAW